MGYVIPNEVRFAKTIELTNELIVNNLGFNCNVFFIKLDEFEMKQYNISKIIIKHNYKVDEFNIQCSFTINDELYHKNEWYETAREVVDFIFEIIKEATGGIEFECRKERYK